MEFVVLSIRQLVTESLRNLYNHKYRYLLTSILLQVFLMTVGRFVLSSVFRLALRLAGVSSLTQENTFEVIGQTGPFLMLIVYSLLVASFIFLEYICLVYMIVSSYRNVEIRDMLKATWQKIKWLSGPQLFVFLSYLALMIPVGNLGLSSPLLERFRIPDFITGELLKTDLGIVIYYSVIGLVVYLNIRLIYFLPLSVVNDNTPWENVTQSWRLTRQNKFRLIVVIGLFTGLVAGAGILMTYLLSIIFGYLDNLWNNIALQTLFYSLVKGTIYIVAFLNKLVTIEVLVNHLLGADEADQSIAYVTLSESKALPFRYPKWSKLVLLVTVVVSVIYNGVQLYLVNLNKEVLMIAHRGDTTAGVENSLEALEAASLKGADLVEMDVLMTADKQFVVIHDNNLRRLAGRNWNVSEKNLVDIEGLQIFQNDFTSEIVTLETYVKRAQELNQPLLIELKPHGDEPDNYVDLVLAELKRLNIKKTDKVMSLDLKVMEKLEQKAPELSTGYVIPLQFGNFGNYSVDFYVIEDFSYNEIIMLSAEQQGKDLYVWTINDATSLSNYLQSPVNGIITDELALFKMEQASLLEDDSYFARALRLLGIRE
ncbi:glycerophosphoryl diester phosphodiesterase membrane domain-containing protein [Streptococcus merionis]|uniref:glycerophosphoryl diester phosphodiesterase membrane domain-containing protein n=1 Tax=Streptococcus merionis TaxID=400065 RepID=UPI0003829C00|nr:glycerophosphodiester phosphodiesterase [Streptococcus merionis]